MQRLTIMLCAGLALPAPASAQYIGGRAPDAPPPPVAGTIESPEASLARNVRLLAINPRDYNGLLGAGRAALRLGDAQAAIGFFGRAEEINPAHWAPKAGQGSALAQMGEGAAALDMFEQSQRLGATQTMIALDRGLAFDLLGQQAQAQSDYRAVLAGIDEAEARRRLALSLAISGRRPEALNVLDPLLARRDAGARRARAFILALGGDLEGARQAIGAVMPGVGSGFDPFLRRLPTLGPGQKAAAVHLGMMPAEGAALAAAAEPAAVVPAASPPVKVASASPVASRVATVTPPPARVAPATPPPIKVAAAGPPAEAEPIPNSSRLADIETGLSRLAAAPPAPRPIVEAPARRAAARKVEDEKPARLSARETAAAKKKGAEEEKPVKLSARESAAARKKAEEEKKVAAKKKDDDAKPAKAGSSRVYVQLAGGANADRMGREFERIRSRKSSLFKGRQPLVSEVKGWARLLVGPFKDADSAQEFVNDLHAARLEGFVWTAPAATRFEKLASK